MKKNATFYKNRSPLLLLGILVIASVLRVTFTSVAPLLDEIRAAFSLSTTQTGIITTLPLLVFALFSPASAKLAHNFGIERCLFAALILVCGGIILRSSGYFLMLWLGTFLIGLGISLGNVLLPGLIKRDFPDRVPHITGVYSLTMGTAAAIGSTLMIPLSYSGLGWKGALLSLIIFPILALLVWLPQIRYNHIMNEPHGNEVQIMTLWRSPLAWQVTLFLGLNSLVYYMVISWLPSILIGNGFSPEKAGSLHGLLQLSSAIPGLFIGPILSRLKDQSAVAILASLLCTLSILGLCMLPALAAVWVVIYGIGGGATIILGLTFVGLRANTSKQASSLSGMAQSIGYLLAAFGPPVMGFLHDICGGWKLPLWCIIVLTIIMSIVGALAGRSLKIGG